MNKNTLQSITFFEKNNSQEKTNIFDDYNLYKEIKEKIFNLSENEKEKIISAISEHLDKKKGELRGIQIKGYEKFIEFFKEGGTKGLIKQPAGAGKTRLFGEIIAAFLGLNKNSLILVPYTNLITDTQKELEKIGIEETEINTVNPSLENELSTDLLRKVLKNQTDEGSVTIITYSGLNSIKKTDIELYQKLMDSVDLVVGDEGHTGIGEKTQEHYNNIDDFKKLFLFFTASQDLRYKSIKGEIGGIKTIDSVTTQEAVKDGITVMPTIRKIGGASYKLKKGESLKSQGMKGEELEKFLVSQKYEMDNGKDIFESFTDEYIKDKESQEDGKLPAIAFCSNKKEAYRYEKYLKLRGIKAKTVVSGSTTTPDEAKEMIRNNIENKEGEKIDVVITVEKLAEGWDLPELRAAIMLTPLSSHRWVIQKPGRAMRSFKGKNSNNTFLYEATYKVGRQEDNINYYNGSKNNKQGFKNNFNSVYEFKTYFEILLEEGEIDLEFLESITDEVTFEKIKNNIISLNEPEEENEIYKKINSPKKILTFFNKPENIIKGGKINTSKYMIGLTDKIFDTRDEAERIKNGDTIYENDLIEIIKGYLIKEDNFPYNTKISSHENLVIYLFGEEELKRVLKIKDLDENIKNIKEKGVKIFYNEDGTINYNLKHFKKAFYGYNKTSDLEGNYKMNLIEGLGLPKETEVIEKIKDDKNNITFINILSNKLFGRNIEYSVVENKEYLKEQLGINDFLNVYEEQLLDNKEVQSLLNNLITEFGKWQTSKNAYIETNHFGKISIKFLFGIFNSEEKGKKFFTENMNNQKCIGNQNSLSQTAMLLKFLLEKEEFNKIYNIKEKIKEDFNIEKKYEKIEKIHSNINNKKYIGNIKNINDIKEIFPLDVLLKNGKGVYLHQTPLNTKIYRKEKYGTYFLKLIKKGTLLKKENFTAFPTPLLFNERLAEELAVILYGKEAKKLIIEGEKNRQRIIKQLKLDGEKKTIENQEVKKEQTEIAKKAAKALEEKDKGLDESREQTNKISEEHEKYIKGLNVNEDWKKIYGKIGIEKIKKIIKLLPSCEIGLDELEIEDLDKINDLAIVDIKGYLEYNFK